MKLLDKHTLSADLAKQKKTQIDEGVALASKVDTLRNTLVTEEGNLKRFREESIKRVQEEIDFYISKKNELIEDIKKAQDTLSTLQKPLDKKWQEVNFSFEESNRLQMELIGREAYIDILQKDANNLYKAANDDKSRIEELKRRANDALIYAEQTLESAKISAKKLQAKTETLNKEALRREMEVATKEQEISSREEIIEIERIRLVNIAKDLSNHEIALKDRYATLEEQLIETNNMADASAILCLSSKANTPSIASSATALAANLNRSAWSIQNLGQNTLYVLLGSGASTTVFHVALRAGTMNDDGTGGSVSQEMGTVYTGIITVAGTSPRYTVTELGIT